MTPSPSASSASQAAPCPRAASSRRAHLDRRHQQRRLALVGDPRERELEPHRVTVRHLQLHFEALGRRCPGQVTTQVLGQQLGKIGMHQLRQRPAHELHGRCDPAELGEPGVGELDAVALDGHRLVHRFGETAVDDLALGADRLVLLQARDQAVGALRQLACAALRGMGPEPLREVAGLGDGIEPFADLADAAHFPRAPGQQHREAHGQQVRRQPGRRSACHCPDWPCPRGTRHPPAPVPL